MAESERRGLGSRVARALVITLVVLVLVVGLPAAVVWSLLFRPYRDVAPDERVTVQVESGSSTGEIGRTLAVAGVVRNANMFRLQVRFQEAEGKLKAGIYDLYTGMSYDEVIDRLRAGSISVYTTVTIPEGFTIDQIAARLEARAGVPATEFATIASTRAESFRRPALMGVRTGSLEGYLFPKTYRVRQGSTTTEVVEMMVDQFEKEAEQLDLSYAESKGLKLGDVVIIASMIEREARLPNERPLVASVVYNRLGRQMRLEIDATVEYVLRDNRFRLRTKDLRTASPYNTYLHAGLPPGPICNPGMASLQAAAHPKSTGYIYYVLTGRDGSHTFANTLAEFTAAKRRSKEVFGK